MVKVEQAAQEGEGGNGRNGVDAEGNIVIRIPQSEHSKIASPISKNAPPGIEGRGGIGGVGGEGGEGGQNRYSGSDPKFKGGNGGQGGSGDFGLPGTKYGKPAQVQVIPT